MNCAQCGKEFELQPTLMEWEVEFCSKQCWLKYNDNSI